MQSDEISHIIIFYKGLTIKKDAHKEVSKPENTVLCSQALFYFFLNNSEFIILLAIYF